MVRTLRLLARGGTLSKLSFGDSNHGSKTFLWKDISVVYRSNTQWRGRSTAASAPSPSDLPNSPKARQRVSLDERKTMVKAYVKRYREANEGKFPSPTGTVKEVGGSYYIVKKIIQELEYHSKSGLSDSEVATSKRSQPIKKRKSVTQIGSVSSKVTVDCGSDDVVEPVATSDSLSSGVLKEESEEQIPLDDRADIQDEIHGVKIEAEKDLTEKDQNTSILEAEKGSTDSGDIVMQEKQHQVSLESEKSVDCGSDDVVEPVATSDGLGSGVLKEDSEVQIPLDDRADIQDEIHGVKIEEAGKDLTEQEAEKGSTDSGGTEMEEKQHQESPESEKSVKETDDSELPQKSSLWENLKSFADGIISIWRK